MPAKRSKPSSSKKADTKSSSSSSSSEPQEITPADRLRQDGIIATFAMNAKKIHRNVRDISASNLTVLYHGTPIIEEAELSLNYGNRYGYIGRNGCGKSTFMRVIDSRCFPIADGIDIFHLAEEIEATDMTAKEAVMSVDLERAKLEAEAEQINDFLATGEEGEEADNAMERLNQVYERLEELDAAMAEVRACKILSGLGFTPEKQNKKTKEFSGGWRMRIALARALFLQPTLLLLDEPTNHLDMEAVVWLEDYLSKWTKILFLVSHSQDFLNNVCTHMVHHTKKKLVYYSGNYDSFCNTRAEKDEEQEKRFKQEQDQIKHMKDYVAKFGQGNAKMARQAQSKEKILDKMLKGGLTDKVEHEKALDFKFPDPGKLSPPVLQCNDITFGYPGCEILYSNVDFGIDLDSRIALVGPNGAGKSTLLKIMTQELLPITGAVRPHAHLKISKFSQHFVDVLDLTMTPLDYFMHLWTDLTREDARKFLGRFGISGSVQTQIIGHLSDGQKSRVVFAKMARENPHMLFLDEPTNHLDMESIDSLAKAINNFEGGLVLVSHDMRLISQVAKEIWLCDNRTVTKYNGEIADFKMRIRGEMQKNNLIEGGNVKSVGKAPPVPVAMAPPIPMAPPVKVKEESEEEMILKTRLELAELAIARQRSRQAQEAKVKETSVVASTESAPVSAPESTTVPKSSPKQSVEKGNEDPTEVLDDKALAKEKKRKEKEARDALKKAQEEELQRRKEQKIKDAEEAQRLFEAEQKAHQEFLIQKAAKNAKKKAEEDAEAALVAEALAKKKAEKEARRQVKLAARELERQAAKAAAEAAVRADPWSQDQQIRFEMALLEFTSMMDKHERWSKIAAEVKGKSMNQCLARYKFLKDFVREKKKLDAATDV